MPSSRGYRSSYDCIVKIKGVTARPILFSQLMRSDGEGVINPEELFADDRSPASEQERVHEDELHSLMRSILDWAISFLSESSQDTIRAISRKKREPQFLLDWRLAAFERWRAMELPDWAHLKIEPIDFQALSYYSAPKSLKNAP